MVKTKKEDLSVENSRLMVDDIRFIWERSRRLNAAGFNSVGHLFSSCRKMPAFEEVARYLGDLEGAGPTTWVSLIRNLTDYNEALRNNYH